MIFTIQTVYRYSKFYPKEIIQKKLSTNKSRKKPAMVAEWSKALSQIQALGPRHESLLRIMILIAQK